MTRGSRTRGSGHGLGSTLFLALVPLVGLGVLLTPGAGELLQVDRAHPLELWRLLSAHLTHYSLSHWLLDALAFCFLWRACRRAGGARPGAAIALAAVAIPLAVLCFLPSIEFYRGLSGIDAALFGALLGLDLRRGGSKASLLAGALFLGKLLYESTTGQAVFLDSSEAGFVADPLAHGVGALCGLLTALWPDRATAQWLLGGRLLGGLLLGGPPGLVPRAARRRQPVRAARVGLARPPRESEALCHPSLEASASRSTSL